MIGHPPRYGPDQVDLVGGFVSIVCADCGRAVRAPGGRLQHQRGRTSPSGWHLPFRIASASWDELEALGLCECGTLLEVHPPLPRPKPLSSGRVRDPGHLWRDITLHRGRQPRSGNG